MGLPGAWTVLLLRAVVVHPAGCGLPLPCCRRTAVAFEKIDPLGTRDEIVFVAAFLRPTRSRAYASPDALPRPAQGSLPAGRAHPSPGGDRTRWTMNRISQDHRISLPSDQPRLVAPISLSSSAPDSP